jgi:DNA repair exonuclease SbcCD nuclease subunit
VHVVDRNDYRFELGKAATLFAVPCWSQAGQDDPTKKLPARAAGDTSTRIGLVHGPTVAIAAAGGESGDGVQPNFFVSKNAAYEKGFDYLALGDTHSYTEVDTGRPPPVVYPGSPEVTNFPRLDDALVAEKEPGSVATVFFRHQPRPPLIRRETVGRFRWLRARCQSLESLRSLKEREGLSETVLELELDLSVTLKEEAELERILGELKGGHAVTGRVAVLQVERQRVVQTTGDFDELLPRMPNVLRVAVERLRRQADGDTAESELAARALRHLYQVVSKELGA